MPERTKVIIALLFVCCVGCSIFSSKAVVAPTTVFYNSLAGGSATATMMPIGNTGCTSLSAGRDHRLMVSDIASVDAIDSFLCEAVVRREVDGFVVVKFISKVSILDFDTVTNMEHTKYHWLPVVKIEDPDAR